MLLAGCLLPLAFAPFNFSLLAVVCLATFFYFIRDSSPARAFILGGLFGLGQFGVGVPWIYISIHDFGGTPFFPSILITCLFILLMSIFPALVGYCSALWQKRWGTQKINAWAPLMIMSILWVLAEWTRGWFLTGFPWLLLGYTQLDTWLGGIAPIGGVYAVSWVIALLAALSVAVLLSFRDENYSRKVITPALSLVFLLLLLCKALSTVSWTHSQQNPITVSLVQGNISQELKWLPTMKWPTIERYFDLSEEKGQKSDLIIWPETAMPVLYSEIEDLLTWYQSKVLKNNPALLLGAPMIDHKTGQLYNGMALLTEEKKQVYYKRHLVPFGEFLPFRGLLSWTAQWFPLPEDDFDSGSEHQVALDMGRYRLALSICYEDAFGNEMLNAAKSSHLLVNVSNDAWFGDSIAADQHLQMARMRALEFGRPMLRATNTGISALIDKKGQISDQAEPHTIAVLSGDVYPADGLTPYMRWGNSAILILLFFMLIYVTLFPLRRRNTV